MCNLPSSSDYFFYICLISPSLSDAHPQYLVLVVPLAEYRVRLGAEMTNLKKLSSNFSMCGRFLSRAVRNTERGRERVAWEKKKEPDDPGFSCHPRNCKYLIADGAFGVGC